MSLVFLASLVLLACLCFVLEHIVMILDLTKAHLNSIVTSAREVWRFSLHVQERHQINPGVDTYSSQIEDSKKLESVTQQSKNFYAIDSWLHIYRWSKYYVQQTSKQYVFLYFHGKQIFEDATPYASLASNVCEKIPTVDILLGFHFGEGNGHSTMRPLEPDHSS